MMPSVLHKDAFSPVLLSSRSLDVSGEQTGYIKKILDVACSDSKFSEKAYAAIWLVLTKGPSVPPVVTSLVPNTAEVGDPDFTLHVHGTGFKAGDKIIFAGQPEPTTVVSATELTTGVMMSLWVGPDSIPVFVESADGIVSDPMSFTFTDGIALASLASKETKTEKVYDKKK
jgi:hypothetical protein